MNIRFWRALYLYKQEREKPDSGLLISYRFVAGKLLARRKATNAVKAMNIRVMMNAYCLAAS